MFIQLQSNMYKEVTSGTKKKWSSKTGDRLKEVSIYMKLSMTGQAKGNPLIQKTALSR